MAYVIIGATGGLGRALSERLATDGRTLVLVARNEGAVEALARDLRDRFGNDVAWVAADLTEGPAYLDRVIAAVDLRGGIEALLLPLGLSVRDGLATPPETLRTITNVNFLAVVEAVTVLWPRLAAAGATVVGFGSITAIRGRGRNFVYGAAKRALAAYFESLLLIAHDAAPRVQFWVAGFLATDAMQDEPTPLPKGDPYELARRVTAALSGPSGVHWYPRWWRAVSWTLRLMPWALYKRAAGANR